MSKYTPTTEEVRDSYISIGSYVRSVNPAAEFDRWLEQVKKEARDEGEIIAENKRNLEMVQHFRIFKGEEKCEREHRGPAGPNEDVASCWCGKITYSIRPWGETLGNHLPDCSLPIWHKNNCAGGGSGHPEAPKIRG